MLSHPLADTHKHPPTHDRTQNGTRKQIQEGNGDMTSHAGKHTSLAIKPFAIHNDRSLSPELLFGSSRSDLRFPLRSSRGALHSFHQAGMRLSEPAKKMSRRRNKKKTVEMREAEEAAARDRLFLPSPSLSGSSSAVCEGRRRRKKPAAILLHSALEAATGELKGEKTRK
ncbi:hypothetical protein Baya_1530 [Bagarius yarrelli]|uniref:Uncharacterized protein n=1 Tax=Bagarius yarrelli TaxID=175774 RepID=A0A556TLD2_BAGYA|nr:hypothetical protein Baya_1530 [Bagarius yarrelli]